MLARYFKTAELDALSYFDKKILQPTIRARICQNLTIHINLCTFYGVWLKVKKIIDTKIRNARRKRARLQRFILVISSAVPIDFHYWHLLLKIK